MSVLAFSFGGNEWTVPYEELIEKMRILLPTTPPTLLAVARRAGTYSFENMNISGLAALDVEMLIKLTQSIVATPKHPFIGEDAFCPCCGQKLDNLTTGIYVIEKHRNQKSVCNLCLPFMEKKGWRFGMQAKSVL